jgi:homoserine dehydrogenase
MLGHGTVGRGVVEIVRDASGDLQRRTGVSFEIVGIAVRDLAKHQAAAAVWPITEDADAMATLEQADVVVELVGGVDRARELVTAALQAGKSVVTANKALLAAHGAELLAVAREHNVSLAFEASCGGGVPIVGSLVGGLLGDDHRALVGILNGTSNAILSSMTARGVSYEVALHEAQDAGYAEADPTLDVDGSDAAQKLAILSGLAFGERIDPSKVYKEGIDGLDPRDVAYATELGYVIKLLAVAKRDEKDRLALSVFPGFLPAGDAMADVNGPFNAVGVYGKALGRSLFVGRGAGGMPTAAAVVSDLLSVATGAYGQTFGRVRAFADRARNAEVIDFGQTQHRYYLRLIARDAPGVLADVTRALGEAGISLASVTQREAPGEHESVPVVITTHLAREASVQSAVATINQLPAMREPAAVVRIVDMPREPDVD